MTTRARPTPLLLLTVLLCAMLGLAVSWPTMVLAEPLSGTIDQRSRQQVTAVFTEMRTALTTGNGAAALAQLSRASIARLEAVRNAAKLGSAAPLAGFSPSEKLGVLGLRRHFTPADLRRLKTPDLLNRAITARWVKPDMLRTAELGPVAVSGNHASAPVLVDGKPSLARAEFLRESGQWRLDLARTTASADTLLRVLIPLSGQSEESYLGHLLDHLRR